MIWTLWKPSRPNNGPFAHRRKSLAGRSAILVPAACLVLSGAAAAYSFFHVPNVQETKAALVTEAAQETPGYGVSGYFSLEGEGGSAIRVAPRSPAGRPALDIQLQGGRLRVTSSRAEGGILAMRLIDARGRAVRTWNEILPPGGSAVLALDGKARGLLFLQVDGGDLGRAVQMVPPLRVGAW
jgi:hypothetical protein